MDRKDFQIIVAFGEKICQYRVRQAGIGRYIVFGKSRSVTITLDHKLISGQMHQLCVGLLAEAIRYKEFYQPGGDSAASQRPGLLKELGKGRV